MSYSSMPRVSVMVWRIFFPQRSEPMTPFFSRILSFSPRFSISSASSRA